MACEAVIAPAPIAITTIAASNGVVIPNAYISDESDRYNPIIPAVVVIATVDEPCDVFSIAAITNGKKIPKEESVFAFCCIYCTNPASIIICPKTLPDAVIKMIGPEVLSASCVKSYNNETVLLLSNRGIEHNNPAVNAMIGFPENMSMLPATPEILAKDAMEPPAIRIIGSRIGETDRNVLGNSHSLYTSEIDEMSRSSADFIFLPINVA